MYVDVQPFQVRGPQNNSAKHTFNLWWMRPYVMFNFLIVTVSKLLSPWPEEGTSE